MAWMQHRLQMSLKRYTLPIEDKMAAGGGETFFSFEVIIELRANWRYASPASIMFQKNIFISIYIYLSIYIYICIFFMQTANPDVVETVKDADVLVFVVPHQVSKEFL